MNTHDDDTEINNDRRLKPLVTRYRRYKLHVDPINCYRKQLMLFMPWPDEINEIENINHEEVYQNNIQVIQMNQAKYSKISDDELDLAVEQAFENIKDCEEGEIEDFKNNRLDEDQMVDIFDQAGIKKSKPQRELNTAKYTTPKTLPVVEINKKIQNLNHEQRKIVMHILHMFKTNNVPFQIYLAGSAGVGKSTTINAIYQITNSYYNSLPNSTIDVIHVLLCAPSGKAAFLIDGITLHTAFSLPVVQYGGQMPPISSDKDNSIREKLRHLKLLIIDEISMVGARLLSRIDTRLQQIMQMDAPFGGISVLVVGDSKQLPPVMDKAVYECANITELNQLVDSPLWSLFEYYPLITIMRRKNETAFIY